MKNKPNFFNWQGNHLGWQDYFPWLFLGLTFLILIILFLTKDLIKARFDRGGKFLWFKSDVVLWRWVGIIGLSFALFKTIMFSVTLYPLYWSNFNLHICRIHVMIVFGSMAIGKFKWVKYITYVAFAGTLAGFFYGTEISTIVNNHASSGKTWEQAVAASPGYEYRLIDELIYKDGFTFFNVGLDNYWLYDFVLAHLSIVFFPMFIRIAYGQKFSIKELHYMQLAYVVGMIVFWSTNALTDEFASDPHWKMNNWYIGNEKANDYLDTLGWVSRWPQNLFTYSFLGVIFTYICHYTWMLLDKFHFFKENKFLIITKSRHWEEYKKENKLIQWLNKKAH